MIRDMEPLTWAERTSALLGIVFGAFVIYISLDLLSGGALTRALTRTPAEEPADDTAG
jgi:hypothetical protein